MAVKETGGKFRIHCDIEGCQARTGRTGTSFIKVLQRARAHGWKQVAENGIYKDRCPEHG